MVSGSSSLTMFNRSHSKADIARPRLSKLSIKAFWRHRAILSHVHDEVRLHAHAMSQPGIDS
jgi:hypothetical protein